MGRLNRFRVNVLNSLRVQLVLLVLIGLLPALLFTVLSGLDRRQHEMNDAHEDALELATLVARDQERSLEGTRQLLVALSLLPEVRDLDASGCTVLLRNLMASYPAYANLAAARSDGEVVCSALPISGTVNIRDREYFQAALNNRTFAVGDYQIGRITTRQSMSLAQPIVVDDQVVGVVFASLDLDWLNQFIDSTALPPGATLTVLDDEGRVLARRPNPEQWVGSSLGDVPLVREVLVRSEGISDLPDVDGTDRLSGFSRTRGADDEGNLLVVVGIPTADVVAGVNQALLRETCALGAVILLALLGAWFGADRLVLRRAREIIVAMNELAGGNLGIRLGRDFARGELRLLARAFDRMAATLAKREHERDQSNEALSASERLYRTLIESIDDSVFAKDIQGRYIVVNSEEASRLSRTREELLGRTALEVHDELTRSRVEADDRQVFETGQTVEAEYERLMSQELRVFETRKVPLRNESGVVIGLVGVSREVTARKRAERELRESEERLRQIVEQAPFPMSVNDPSGAMLIANSAFLELLRIPQAETAVGAYNAFTDAGLEGLGVLPAIRRACQGEKVLLNGVEVPLSNKADQTSNEGGPRAVAIHNVEVFPVFGEDGLVQQVVTVWDDVTEERRQAAQLCHLARHDPLTDLPNRRVLDAKLARAIAQAAKTGRRSTLLYLDVDHFKDVNDSFGHKVGDELIVSLGRLIQDSLRSSDGLLARIGGDEFAVLLDGVCDGPARSIAERLRSSAADHCFMTEGHQINLGLSVGTVELTGDETPTEALARADAALYRAKLEGRNRVVVFDPTSDDLSTMSESNRTALKIKSALRAGRLLVHYQPIVSLATGEIEHYEALARLANEDGTLLSPGEFIPVAERFGLTRELTRQVVREVVRRLGETPGVSAFVNLSADCLIDGELQGFVEECLHANGVAPDRLGFEVTETMLVQNFARAEVWISHLRDLGCRFALDDFGAGFSSLGYLRRLPFDELKLDGSLVLGIEHNPTQQAMVHAIGELASALGKVVVAECVETWEAAATLRMLGVDWAQGYYFARPSPMLPQRITVRHQLGTIGKPANGWVHVLDPVV